MCPNISRIPACYQQINAYSVERLKGRRHLDKLICLNHLIINQPVGRLIMTMAIILKMEKSTSEKLTDKNIGWTFLRVQFRIFPKNHDGLARWGELQEPILGLYLSRFLVTKRKSHCRNIDVLRASDETEEPLKYWRARQWWNGRIIEILTYSASDELKIPLIYCCGC